MTWVFYLIYQWRSSFHGVFLLYILCKAI